MWPTLGSRTAKDQIRSVLFVSISQVIGCKDRFRIRNDLYCVEWGVKLYSNQPNLTTPTIGVVIISHHHVTHFKIWTTVMSLELVEAIHFTFQIVRTEYQCMPMHVRFCQYGMCLESPDLS